MRVLVVGNGMVGSRLVEELDGAGLDVTVLGSEPYEPYNRVLLSEVVAGKVDVAAITLPRPGGSAATVRTGRTALAIDRDARLVLDDAGDAHAYDVLVLATGARARIPEVPGLAPLPAGAHALRTLDDAREIVAATTNARRAVVVGGGVLGLEAACGLARRGLHVTVVHGGAHLMDRQLDADAAAAVVHGLDRLRIEHRTGAVTREVVVADRHVRGVRLAARGADATEDGEVLPADLLVLTTGTLPETGLAAAAGLEVRRGVVVDADGVTSDPAVFAVGDCAEPPDGATGLIAQGWDQARRLADLLRARAGGRGGAAREAAPVHGTDVVRLKAAGLEVVAMGVCGPGGGRQGSGRSVRLSDPETGRHVEVVVQDGVVVGATAVGAGPVAADLVAAYTRRTPAPRDPAQLLLRPVRGSRSEGDEPSPTLMPDRATVCRCNGVTKGDVVACWRHGATSVEDVARSTRATTGCGGCTDAVCGIVDWLRRSDPPAATPDGPDGADGPAPERTVSPEQAGSAVLTP
ncbi:NAD(P)/FAD-dependent oxidoreductase [Actinotalea ferrariae]|uniref:FAD-dependent oxidoreductase n=1 Tax=Actinotalea ferrariae TaxID=1386098 RepID=UPI001C8B25BC|nr:FAD-dependent oxidoreductase [Actinotalea ferrariae]MBX9246939.1 NAD(P)/FAD-dependent oxidoreductase [Actinotalea ferrariae]